jgi:hypothetical protein
VELLTSYAGVAERLTVNIDQSNSHEANAEKRVQILQITILIIIQNNCPDFPQALHQGGVRRCGVTLQKFYPWA